jgi:hypothetical protein
MVTDDPLDDLIERLFDRETRNLPSFSPEHGSEYHNGFKAGAWSFIKLLYRHRDEIRQQLGTEHGDNQ